MRVLVSKSRLITNIITTADQTIIRLDGYNVDFAKNNYRYDLAADKMVDNLIPIYDDCGFITANQIKIGDTIKIAYSYMHNSNQVKANAIMIISEVM